MFHELKRVFSCFFHRIISRAFNSTAIDTQPTWIQPSKLCSVPCNWWRPSNLRLSITSYRSVARSDSAKVTPHCLPYWSCKSACLEVNENTNCCAACHRRSLQLYPQTWSQYPPPKPICWGGCEKCSPLLHFHRLPCQPGASNAMARPGN